MVTDVRERRSAVLVLRGEPGVGKSALLDDLAERASDCRVARIAGIEAEMELAFAGLHQLCAPMLDRLERLPPPQRDALAVAFGLASGRPPDRFLVGLATLSLLADVAAERPLVCLVDDGQWLDRTSLHALAFAARRLNAESVGLVFATREADEESELDGLPELGLGGLGAADARALLDAVVPWPLDERIKDRIVAESGGNPLALLEVCNGVTPAELELGLGQANTTPLVNRIENRFVLQMRALPADTRRLLLIAAVEPLGDVQLLERAAESLDLSLDAAVAAQAAGLFELGLRAQFRHPLIRSAVRRTAAPDEVRRAHQALADATDAALDPDRRAWHRAHGAARADEAVAAELDQAATRARKRGGYASAASILERAIQLTPDPSRRASRALSAALMSLFAADHAGGLRLIAIAEGLPLDEADLATLAWVRASLLMSVSRTDEGSLSLLDAARRLGPLDPLSARSAHVTALGARIFVGRVGAAQRNRDFAAAARAAPPAPDPPRVTDLLLDALATRYLDGYEAAVTPIDRAIRACARDAEPGMQLVEWITFVPTLPPEVWNDGEWDLLTSHLVALTRRSGSLLTLPMALDYRASFEIHAGRLGAAEALLHESAALKTATHSTPALSWVELAAWRGDRARAVDEIDASVSFWSSRGDARWIALGEYARAVLSNGLGDYDTAFEAARFVCEHHDIGIAGWALAELVEAAARTGNADVAEDAIHRLDLQARAADTDWALGVAARSRALVSNETDADVLFQEAITHLGGTRMQTDLSRAHLLYGEWLRRKGRRIDAREHLRLALDAFLSTGATGFGERARAELAATGERLRKRSVDTGVHLTAQEAQIARLAAERHTNPEIATQLYISARTVEYHLAKVYTKLGITSRKALPAALRKLRPTEATPDSATEATVGQGPPR